MYTRCSLISNLNSSFFQGEENGPLDSTVEDPHIHVGDSDYPLTSITQLFGDEQVIKQSNTASNGEEEESAQLYNLANSILQECNDSALLSDLDTAIHFFHKALDRRPATHPLRSDSLKDLAAALVTRFSLTNLRQDINRAILCYRETWNESCDDQFMGVQTRLDVRVPSLLFWDLALQFS